MPHISRKKIDESALDKLFTQLVKIISPSKTNDARKVLSGLLTATEKVMLAKRLAAILMISEGASIYEIASKLHVSTSTAKRMHMNYRSAEYEELLGVLKRRKVEREKFWELVGKISRLGMPSMGKDRWKALK